MINIIKHCGESVILRTDYMAISGGDICTSLILAAFEEWTVIKLVNNRGDLEDTWINVHVDTIVGCVLGSFGRSKVLASFECLVHDGWVEQRPSEDPFGWTFICRLNVEKVQKALDEIRHQVGGAA